MEAPSTTQETPNPSPPESKFFYESFQELVDEWQNSELEVSLWEYLGISGSAFGEWKKKMRKGVFDA